MLTAATSGHLGEVSGVDASLSNTSIFLTNGHAPTPFSLETDGMVSSHLVDSETRQEGAVQLTWTGAGQAMILGPTLKLEREANAEMNVQLTYRLDKATTSPVTLALGSGKVRINSAFAAAGSWAKLKIPLKCFAEHGSDLAGISKPFTLSSNAPFTVTLADMRLATDPAGAVCPN